MKRILIIVSVVLTFLSACTAAPASRAPEPIVTELPTLAVQATQETAPTAAAPNPKLPASSFESQPYVNGAAGFALDYPVGWTVNETVLGERASQVQFLSSPELAEAATLPEGVTRVNAVVYQWDPKNDLAAFAAQQKSAWEASGFTIVEEEPLVLELGLPAVRFTVQTPEAQVVYLIAALRDQYLVLSGEGDLELVREIVQRVRPISP